MVWISKTSVTALSSKLTISTITAKEIFPKNLKIGVGHFLWPSITYFNEKKSWGFRLVDLAWNFPYTWPLLWGIFFHTEKKTMVVTTNSHCKSVKISGTIFDSWDYYNHIVESTIIILYYILLVDITIKNIFSLREI